MEQSLHSKFQSRGPRVERCEIVAGDALFSDGETIFNTELAYNLVPVEAMDNNQDDPCWHSTMQLLVKAEALNNQEGLRYRIIYEAGCEFRYFKDVDDDKDYDWFSKQVERIGLSTLISAARAHLQGVVGLLGFPAQFIMPMVDLTTMIKAHHAVEQEEAGQE